MEEPTTPPRPAAFYKYLPLDSAKSALKNQTLRWSSPLLFDDPFDVPREVFFEVGQEKISRALLEYVWKLMTDPPEVTSNLHKELETVVRAVKLGLPKPLNEKLIAEYRQMFSDTASSTGQLDGFRELWRRTLGNLRILCLAESPAHLPMWYHYADRYAGAVLEFRQPEQGDSIWLRARAVAYPNSRPTCYTADGWAQSLSLRPEVAVHKLLDAAIFSKSVDWEYEREWRIATLANTSRNAEPFTDFRFQGADLAGVYLGPSLPDAGRMELLELAENYPAAIVRSVSIGMARDVVFNNLRHG